MVTDLNLSWTAPALPVIEGWGYSARIERRGYGEKYPFQWFAEYGHAIGTGFAESIDDAKQGAEFWLKCEAAAKGAQA